MLDIIHDGMTGVLNTNEKEEITRVDLKVQKQILLSEIFKQIQKSKKCIDEREEEESSDDGVMSKGSIDVEKV